MPVRSLDVIRRGIPGVDLDDAHLRERHHGRDVVGDQVLPDFRLLLNLHASECAWPPLLRVLQIDARCRDARRAVDQCQRSALDVRHDPVGDALEVADELPSWRCLGRDRSGGPGARCGRQRPSAWAPRRFWRAC